MGLLKSANNEPGVDLYEYRDNLYYNKYEYRIRIEIPGSRYTYWCKKPEDLDKKLISKTNGWSGIRKEDVPIVTAHLPQLKELISIATERKASGKYTIRMESNTVAVFSSDLTILQDIEKRIGLGYTIDYTKAQTGSFTGTKYFVNDPKHKYRVYLKTKRVENNFHTEFADMIAKNKSLYPSPALRRWLGPDSKRRGMWYLKFSSSSYFIDYDDESTLSYLALMHGEILGKKYKLEKRPDPI